MDEERDWENLTVESQVRPLKKRVIIIALSMLGAGIVLLLISIPFYINAFDIDPADSIEFGIEFSCYGGGLILTMFGYLLTNELILRRKRKQDIKIPEFKGDEEIPELTEEVLDNYRPNLLEVKEERPRPDWDEEVP